MKKSLIISLIIILLSVVIGIYFYPQLPEMMASHWNAAGEVNGYMSKFWAVFMLPLISVALLVLFIFIPKIDPLKSNIEKFDKYYYGFIVFLIAFLFYVHLLTILWGLNLKFNITQMLSPGFAAFFFYLGILIEKAKKNWFIGIRTPWTLSSDKVWDKTHKIGGKLFKSAAIIALLGLVFPSYAIWFVLIPIIAVAIFSIIYSYIQFQKSK